MSPRRVADGAKRLLRQNRAWARRTVGRDPGFFQRLRHVQRPRFLWIGCSDSRVPADRITGTLPGEIFVHRNIANLVVHSDMSVLSVVQYAVEVLKVKDLIVCGHYACGGVRAALAGKPLGLVDNWLRHLQDLRRLHAKELDALGAGERGNRLVELNILEQARNLARTSTVREAWAGKPGSPRIHAWVYDVGDGVIRDLKFDETFTAKEERCAR